MEKQKIYDETYTIEVFTENGKRYLFMSYDGSTGYCVEFDGTYDDMMAKIRNYIEQADYDENFLHMK